MKKSMIHKKESGCFLCGAAETAFNHLDEHHVYGGANRKKSEQYGLKVYLCHDKCHLQGVHAHRSIDVGVKAFVQEKAMQHYGWTVEAFIKLFGRNYLDN